MKHFQKSLWSLFLLLCSVLIISACSSSETEGTNDDASVEQSEEKEIRYLTASFEDEGTASIISQLAKEYAEQHEHVTFEFENVGGGELQQQVQLLAASNDLPAMFAFDSGQPLKALIESGAVLNIEETFKELDIYDQLNPAAASLLTQQVDGDGLYAVPLEMNIEGFWYNKSIFEEHGLEVPTTWDEMLQVAETLHQAGIQPFSVAGMEKWPITRLINAYVMRLYGHDVMERVKNGEVKVTDEGFIEAARVIQEMGLKGYFGKGVNTIDYTTATDMFLQGEAAMYYMGSWEVQAFNNEERAIIGSDNIDFFNIPLVEGGVGTLNDYSINTGLTTSFSAEAYDETMADFMEYVFSNYADRAMIELGLVTPYTVSQMPDDIPRLTRLVQENIDSAENGALWFEAYFTAQEQAVAWDQAQYLVDDARFTPEFYMEELQKAMDKD
ncbi:ABC transporter substrate-binding protein [Bacillus solitudinis]|uniref:ABC transporter substrate-binding protein n=1 Tax=Bacillus solitudinis TaxID=2014074 RepID=UPI000C239B14|nr:extracellular solute-binding protein [Bacillus solitudinis]